jgi:hypothetical protein
MLVTYAPLCPDIHSKSNPVLDILCAAARDPVIHPRTAGYTIITANEPLVEIARSLVDISAGDFRCIRTTLFQGTLCLMLAAQSLQFQAVS